MPAMRILIIEDDRQAASYLVKAFREAGHVADDAADGLDGYAMAREGALTSLVVDRMLPKLDGLSLIRSLREQGVDTPVLISSALGQVDDRVKGLRAGGDDYLPKPYAFSELLARVEVLVRRRAASGTSEPTAYRVADLELDRLSHRVMFSISQMDVPTRQSYIMAVVSPEERSAAAGITGVARTIGAAISPLFVGFMFARPALINLPFFIAGTLKIIYDLLLYREFVAVQPTENLER